MNITGREIGEYEAEQNDENWAGRPVFHTLGEVVIEGGPKGLRKLASFLKDCARHMAKGGEQDHFHYNGRTTTRPQIVVINKRIAEERRLERERDIAADPDQPTRTALWYVEKALSRVPAAQRRAVLDEAVRRRTPAKSAAKRLREEAIATLVETLDIAEKEDQVDVDALVARAAATLEPPGGIASS
jgi:hypothetical protein